MGNSKKRKWTVFFLIKAPGGESMKHVIRMINEIRSIKMNEKVAVVMALNFIREDLPALIRGDISLLTSSSQNQTVTTMFFRLMPELKKGAAYENRLLQLGEKEEFDITDPDFIEKSLREYIYNHCEAKRYLLFSWDHGAFFGIFPDRSSQAAKKRFSQNSSLKKADLLKILTMDELDFAIRGVLGRKKIDVAIMMNCFMQFIDSGYALRKSVKYLVAPETDIFLDGYNYPAIFLELNQFPDIKPKELARLSVRSFASKQSYDGDVIAVRSKPAIFAVDLHHYKFLVKHIDRLALFLAHKVTEVKGVIDKVKSQSDISSARNVYDLISLIEGFKQKKIINSDNESANLILSVKDLIIFESFKSILSAEGTPINEIPKGISIFLPNALPNPQFPNSEFDSFFETEFYKTTKWRQLVEALNK